MARVFDGVNLVIVRMILAGFRGLSILVYFLTELLPVIIVGQIILNVAFSGGPIFRHLWVTRIAPPGETPVYMSVHTFMTGIRGSLAPVIGFLSIAGISFRTMGAISALGIASAILLHAPLRKDPRALPPRERSLVRAQRPHAAPGTPL